MSVLSFPTKPMRAVSGDLPRDDGAWAFEIKWDGMRALAFVGADGSVRLQSSNSKDITASFPELASLGVGTRGRPAVLDGEIVAFDSDARPNFARLQLRMHVTAARDVSARAAQVPVFYQLFDLLAFDGIDATGLAYEDRRRLLAQIVSAGPHFAVPAHHVGGGAELLQAAADLGLEGVMAKRLTSRYEPGRRSSNWTKIKVRRRQELVVGGWATGEGRRNGQIGSLLVGYRVKNTWRYAGRVGTGFSEAELHRLGTLLRPLEQRASSFNPLPSPSHCKGVTWVEPVLVVEVAFGNWTLDGLLRHPSYLGQRADKDPKDVVRED